MIVAVALDLDSLPQLARWAVHFAAAADESRVLMIRPVRRKGPEQIIDFPLDDHRKSQPFAQASRAAFADLKTAGVSVTAREVRAADPVRVVLEQVSRERAGLLVIPRSAPLKGEAAERSIERQLFSRAPCRTMLLRCGPESGRRCRQIVVAAAGGPHAADALKLAVDVCKVNRGEVTALYVEPDVGLEAELVGRRILDGIVRKSLGSIPRELKTEVVIAYFSGLAAAYAMGRPNLSSALPGVAIVLGTACSLWAVGIRSGHSHGQPRHWVGRAALALLLVTLILAVTLYYKPF